MGQRPSCRRNVRLRLEILPLKLVTILGAPMPTGNETAVNIDGNIVYCYSHALLPSRRYIIPLVSTLGKNHFDIFAPFHPSVLSVQIG